MPEINATLATGQRPLTVREFAKLGYDELRAMHARGELPVEALGIAADGAQAYLGAMADGDVAKPELAMMRACSMASGCVHCPSRTTTPTELTHQGRPMVKVWCGKPGKPNTEGPRRTCGCLVALMTQEPDQVVPGPKVWVGSERCPQGLW